MSDLADTSFVASLLDAIPDPLLLVEPADRIGALNSAAHALFPAARAGDMLALVLRSPDVLDAVARARRGGSAETVNWRERVPIERTFDVRVAPLRGITGANVLLHMRDLTEAHRVERMRVDFVANASHELRTPLASLLGFVETLQGAARDDPIARGRFLTIMRDQARRMARLIDDLLSLSRIEQNLHVPPREAVDLVAVVGHVLDTLRPMAEDAHVALVLDAPPHLWVTGDRDELLRVAENLVENAIKYGMPANSSAAHIDITLADTGTDAILSVRDHGPGIAPRHIARLTERFYRVDAGESRAKGGTGLGLAIVKHIVARHRGQLAVESHLGAGATFHVRLPLHIEKT